jgi:hypothetical protein
MSFSCSPYPLIGHITMELPAAHPITAFEAAVLSIVYS